MEHSDKEGNDPNAAPQADSHELTDYTVGYGKPPMQRRFKSGQSGNQRGRPHGSKNRKTILNEIANEMHTVTVNGKRRRRSTLVLMLFALRNLGAEGNVREFRAYKKYLAKYEPQETNSEHGYLVVPAGKTPEEEIAEAEKVNAEASARRAAQSQE
jgi:hypothetical protein